MQVLVLPGWYPGKFNATTGDFVMYQSQALVKAGIQASIIYSDVSYKFLFSKYPLRHKSTFAVENGVPTYRLEGFFPPKVSLFLLKKWAKKYEMLYAAYLAKNGKPDIIHAHTFLGGFAAMHLSQKFDVPYIVTEHNVGILTGELKSWHLPIIKAVYQQAALVIAVSKGLKNSIQKKFTNNKVIVVPNFIDVDLFALKKTSPKKRLQFIAIGELLPVKGFDVLIQAFYQLKQETSQAVQLTIVGDGQEKEKLLQWRKKLELEQEVVFAGECSQQEVAQGLQASDVFVLSSHLETFGIVVIEAMSCGLPVIATKCLGPEDVLTSEVGLLIPPNDVTALAQAMKTMLLTSSKYNSKRIRNYVIKEFSHTAITKRLFTIYDLITKDRL